MTASDRSVSNVLQDIVCNIQEIVRAEVRLAKTEFREDAQRAKGAVIVLGTGILFGVFAALFLLWTLVFALAMAMPTWAAASIMAVILAVIAGVALHMGLKRFQKVAGRPERTIETVKENVQWAKQQMK